LDEDLDCDLVWGAGSCAAQTDAGNDKAEARKTTIVTDLPLMQRNLPPWFPDWANHSMKDSQVEDGFSKL
jgi:hypothetical protein